MSSRRLRQTGVRALAFGGVERTGDGKVAESDVAVTS
jgi:hypothetical protein